MSGPPAKRRRTKAIGPDSTELAKAFTHKTITTTNRSGTVVKKDILVPLVPTKSTSNETPSDSSLAYNNDDVNIDGPLLEENEESSSSHNRSTVCESKTLIQMKLVI